MGGPRSPGIVQTLQWMYRPVPFIERCRRRYGSIFRVRLGPSGRTIVVADPAAARAVVAGDPAVYRAGDANGIVRPVVGAASLLVLDGEEHRAHRRILMPAFAAGHAHAFAETVERITRERVSRWPVGKTISLQDEMEAISFEATASRPRGPIASPTSAGAARINSGSAAGFILYSPLHPATASTTYRLPAGSNASPCGRPKPAYSTSTRPLESMR